MPLTRVGVTSLPLMLERADLLASSVICWACCSCRLFRTPLRNCCSLSCWSSACSKSRPLTPPLNCTPIALPSQASLDVVVAPPSTGYLYFVSRGDGTSEFSANLIEHNRAVSKYQKGGR